MDNPRPRPGSRVPLIAAAAADIVCVLAFVMIGRASHTKGENLAGIASTAWPFLAGLAIGWAAALVLARTRKRGRAFDPGGLAPAGTAAWLGTVAAGMVLRVIGGQGTAVSFIIVALIFNGLFLLGWRAAVPLAARLAGRAGHVRPAGRRNEV